MQLFKSKLIITILIAVLIGSIIYFNTFENNIDFNRKLFDYYDTAISKLGLKGTSKTVIYSSVDDKGHRQYSDMSPSDNNDTRVLTIDPNANVVPAVPTKPTDISGTKPTNSATTVSPLTPYTNPKQIVQLVEDAKNIEQNLQDRKSAMDKQIDN